MTGQTNQRSGPIRYVLLVGAVLALALAGYTGYVLYPRFELPSSVGIGLLILAAGAGIASFFSPCAFPLLATLLARETGMTRRAERKVEQPLGKALLFAGALSIGATLFLLLAGAGIAAGAAPFFASVTFTSVTGRAIRTVVGLLLILLGLVQLGYLSVSFGAVERATRPLMQRQARMRRENPIQAFALFGFLYLLAGFG